MKLISATLGALAVAAVSFVGTAQAQGYYAAPGYSQGGAISLGQTGTIGYRPQYYYGQPQYVVRRTMKPIWATTISQFWRGLNFSCGPAAAMVYWEKMAPVNLRL